MSSYHRTLRQFRQRMPLTAVYAAENGWVLENSFKHPKLVKGGAKYAVPRSPSDLRADMNALSELKKIDLYGDTTNGRQAKAACCPDLNPSA